MSRKNNNEIIDESSDESEYESSDESSDEPPTVYLVKEKLDKLCNCINKFVAYHNKSCDRALINLLRGVMSDSYRLLQKLIKNEKINEMGNDFNFTVRFTKDVRIHIKRHIKKIAEYNEYMEYLGYYFFDEFNAQILRMGLKYNIIDGKSRYPRCPHNNKPVGHALYVESNYYSNNKTKHLLLFLICEECAKFVELNEFEFSIQMYSRVFLYQRGFLSILGYKNSHPLNFRMY